MRFKPNFNFFGGFAVSYICRFKPQLSLLLGLILGVGGVRAQAPDLFLMDASRLSEIQSLVTQSGTTHQEAFDAMKARIDPGDPLAVDGSYPNYKRAFYAREAAFLYRVTGEAHYADKAYAALDDIYNSTTPFDTRRPDNGSGLNRSQTLSSFAIAYNWAYDGFTQPERDWILSKIVAGLDSYGTALGHANIGSPYASNWNGVVAGGHVMTLIAAGLKEERLVEYQSSRSILEQHIGSLGDRGWTQEGEGYFSLSLENALPAVLAMNHIGDTSAMDTLASRRIHHMVMYANQLSASQASTTHGVGTGAFYDAGVSASLFGLVPDSDRPYYKWQYDHFRGIDNPAAAADKYDHAHGGTAILLIHYPENTTASNPTGHYPEVMHDSKGGYILRSGWADGDDLIVSLWADGQTYNNAWNQPDVFHMNFLAYGAKWGSGPTTASPPAPATLSTLHVDGQVPIVTSTGSSVEHRSSSNGAYAVVGGSSAYGTLGVSSAERHVLTDFSQAGTYVVSVADTVTAAAPHTYSWNISLPVHTISSGTESGVPYLLATDDASGSWMKLWCLTPGAAAAVDSSSARFDLTASDVDIWVVAQIGPDGTTPDVISLTGSGLDALATIGGRSLAYDSTAKTISSSGLTDLRILPDLSLNASASNGLAPLSVDFSVDAGGLTGLSYAWDFGDGAASTAVAPTHSFTADGSYQVTVEVSDATGPLDRLTKFIYVGNRHPNAVLSASVAVALPDASINFNASGSSDPEGDTLTYAWDFGDGTTATGESVSHSWTAEGNYDVLLQVTDTSGNTTADSLGVVIANQAPVAVITSQEIGGIAPATLTFDGSSSYDPEGGALTYTWDFRDGSATVVTTVPTVSHTFTTAGEYNVKLTVEDTAGKTDSDQVDETVIILASDDIVSPVTPTPGTYGTGLNYAVYSAPVKDGLPPDFNLTPVVASGRVATFDVNVSTLGQRFALRFAGYLDVETAGVYTFKINSMDYTNFYIGSRLVVERAGKFNGYVYGLVYLEAGLHPITLEYAYDDGGDFSQDIPFLEVQWKHHSESSYGEIPPSNLLSEFSVFYPSFRVSPPQGHDGQTFHFEATMPSPDGQPLTYLWDFGDGNTSTLPIVAHSYTLPATRDQRPYNVTLTITDSQGAAYTTGTVVNVSKFAWTLGKQGSDREGLEIYESDYGGAYPIDRRTDPNPGQFSDAVNKARESITSVDSPPSYLPPSNAVDGNYSSRWVVHEDEAWIQFTFENAGGLQPYNITEYALTMNELHWTWASDPKDWEIYGSNAAAPAEFSMAGGAANPDWTLIHSESGHEYFDVSSIIATGGSRERSVANGINYLFDMPNTQAYAHYLFHFRNQDPLQSSEFRLDQIELFDYMDQPLAGNSDPVLDLSHSALSGEAPLTVSLDADASTDPDGDVLYYGWDFGNGQSERLEEGNAAVSHTYYEPGSYDAVLTLRDGHGATATQTVTVTVAAPTANQVPIPDFTPSATNVPAGSSISFDATASSDPDGDALEYFWEFGDGSSGYGSTVDHVYRKDGQYNVLLRVVDSRGGVGLANELITVDHPNEGRAVVSVNLSTAASDLMSSAVGGGVMSVGFWNLMLDNQLTGLKDSLGAETALSISATSTSGYSGGSEVDRFDANSVMMKRSKGRIDNWQIDMQSVPYALYDVYLYYGGNDSSEGAGSFTLDGQTYHMLDNDRTWDGSYERSIALTAGTAAEGQEYVVWQGLSLADFSIAVGGTRVGVAGIQIVDLGGGPLARDDEARIVVYDPVSIDVLANDIGDGLSIQSVGTPSSGTASIQSGQILYTPQAGFEGYATFDYTLVDFEGSTSTGTVTVGVGNLPPVAVDDDVVVVLNVAKTISVLANDYDEDTELPVSLVSITQPTLGSAAISGSDVIYTPPLDYTGADSFTYTIQDADGKTATGTVDVSVVLDPNNAQPVALDDSLMVPPGESVVLVPLLNDSDGDGDPLTIESFTTPAVGTLTDNGDGTLTYSSDAGASGSTSFDYVINDGKGLTATATFTINMIDSETAIEFRHLRLVFLAKNPTLNSGIFEVEWTDDSAPVDMSSAVVDTVGGISSAVLASDDSLATSASLSSVISILSYDFGVGAALTPELFKINADGGTRSIDHFQVQGSADGSNWVQLADVQTSTNDSWQTYLLYSTDGSGVPDTGMISVNFGSNTLAPSESAGAAASANWNNTTGTLANLLDGNGVPTSASVTVSNGSNTYTSGDTPATSGDYNMMSSFNGTLSSSTPITVDVAGLPASLADGGYDVYVYWGRRAASGTYVPSYSIGAQTYYLRDTTYTWDGSHDRSTATTAAAAVDGPNYVLFEGLTGASFSLTVTKGGGDQRYGISGLQIVAAEGVAPNTAPSAADDSATTPEQTAVAVDVLDNDTDAEIDPLSIDSFTQGTNGTVSQSGDQLIYTPTGAFSGTDSFSYTVSDGTDTDTATVTVTVAGQATTYLINFGETAYTTDGSNAWQTFDLTSGDGEGIATDMVALSATTLADTSDSTGAGISLSVTPADIPSSEAVVHAATVSGDFTGNPFAWFDPSVAAQRETFAFKGVEDSGGLTYVFDGFDVSDVVTFEFVVRRASASNVRTVSLVGPGAVTMIDNAQVDESAEFVSLEVTGAISYSFVLTNTSDQWVAAANAIAVGVVSASAPAAASDLVASAVSETAIDLSWSDNSADETGFKVQRSPSSDGPWTDVTTTAADATSYRDTGLSSGTEYFYQVITTSASAESAASTVASASTWTAAESWRYGFFGQTEDSGNAAEGIDFDHGGSDNLLERAFGTDPTDASDDYTPIIGTTESEGNKYMTLTYRRLVGGTGTTGNGYTADGITYTVEHDADLRPPWTIGNVIEVGSPSDNGDGTETVTIRLSSAISGSSYFMRLRVSTTSMAVEDSGSGAEDGGPIAIPVLANDTVADGNTLSIASFTQGANGTVAQSGDDLLYTPAADFNGTDSFTYVATDGADTATATVTVTISAVNDAPVASLTATSLSGEAPFLVDFDGSLSSDIDGTVDLYSLDFGDGQSGGGVTASHTYTLAGSYTATLTVTDDQGLTDTATVVIEVTGPSVSDGNTVSINFGLNTLLASETAGVEPVANWNNMSDTLADAVDENGNPTGMVVTLSGANLGNYSSDDNPSVDGDHAMMSSFRGTYSNTASVTVSLSGLPENFTSGGYDVYVYWGRRSDTGTYHPSYTIDGTTYFIRDDSYTWDGTHDVSTATTSGGAVDGPNYVLFTGLTASNLDLVIANGGGDRRFGISGMQIVPAVGPTNTAPIVTTGSGGSIVLPTDSFELTATVDDDGLPTGSLSYAWSMVSGSAAVTFDDPAALETTAHFTAEGDYVLRLTASDGLLEHFDDLAISVFANPADDSVVSYFAPGLASGLFDAMELSDGTLLLSGGSDDLSWVPAGVATASFSNPGEALSHSSGSVAFIARVSADLSTILKVWHLPAGASAQIQRIRTTSQPDALTGDIYVSGRIDGGYFIGRLNGNVVDLEPTGFDWILPLSTDGEQAGIQAWDVMSDGSVVYQYNHVGDNRVGFIDSTGNAFIMPGLRASHDVGGTRQQGLGSDYPSATDSYIVFPVDVGSWTEAGRTAILPDGNGNLKMGTWPFDIFITETLDAGVPVRYVPENTRNYGYTGYRYTGEVRIGAITVDRRTNDFYIGFNMKSKFYDPGISGEQPDFEPAVIAYGSDGALRWWSRLYTEWEDSDGDSIPDYSGHGFTAGDETFVSSPDQYIDGLAIDYSASVLSEGTLVVNARCHGNNTSNFWSGNDVFANPGATAFHNSFTGTEGNIHISWIGKLDLDDGTLMAATYLGGYFRKGTGNWPTAAYSDPNLNGWPNHNSGWANLTTTTAQTNTLSVDTKGRVYAIGRGPRMVTTLTAWQQLPRRLGQTNPVLDEGVSPFAAFARVYETDLSTLVYSTALTGAWTYPGGDTSLEPEGADNTTLRGVLPLGNQFMVLGYHDSLTDPYTTDGNPVPLNQIPAWGSGTPSGQTGLFGRFTLVGTENWINADIGNVAAAGSSAYDPVAGAFTLTGSGNGFQGTADEGQFTYLVANGDCSIIAELTDLSSTPSTGVAGVSLRGDLADTSQAVSVLVDLLGNAKLVSRDVDSGTAVETLLSGVAIPSYLKLERSGDTISRSVSADGSTWTVVDTVTVPMAETVYIGLVVSSQSDGQVSTAEFSGVSVER